MSDANEKIMEVSESASESTNDQQENMSSVNDGVNLLTCNVNLDIIEFPVDCPSQPSDSVLNEKKEKVCVGISHEILPEELEKLEELNKNCYSSKRISDFCALSAGAQLFLSKTPTTKSKQKSSSVHVQEMKDEPAKAIPGACLPSDQLKSDDSVELLSDSSDVQEVPCNVESGPDSNDPTSKKATFGVTHKLLPEEIENLRKLEKNSYSSSKISNFHSLTTGAQLFLSNASVSRTNPQEPSASPKQPELEKDEDNLKDSEDKLPKQKKTVKINLQKIKDQDEFYCDICDTLSNSESSFTSHLLGKRHQKKFAAAKGIKPMANVQKEYNYTEDMQNMAIEDVIPPKRELKRGIIPKIQNKIDRSDSPCIGLSYITEILRANVASDPIYVCYLCNLLCQPSTVVSHIIGYKHRLNYLKLKETEKYREIKTHKSDQKKSELTRIVEKLAEDIEEQDGRGCVVVEQEIEVSFNASKQCEVPQRELRYNPSPFQVEEIRFLPPHMRMKMLDALSYMNVNEMQTDSDAKRLEFALENMQRALMHYNGFRRSNMPDYPSDSGYMNQGMLPHGPVNRFNAQASATWRPMAEMNQHSPYPHNFPPNRYPRR